MNGSRLLALFAGFYCTWQSSTATNFLVLWLSGQLHNVILPLIGMPPTESRLEFVFQSSSSASAYCVAAFGRNRGMPDNHREAQFVWIIPTIVLALQIRQPSRPACLRTTFAARLPPLLRAADFSSRNFTAITELFADFSPDYAARSRPKLSLHRPRICERRLRFRTCWAARTFGISVLPMFGTRQHLECGSVACPIVECSADHSRQGYFAGRNSIFTSPLAGSKSKSAVTKIRSRTAAASAIPNESA